jgi:hypothetical protein
MHNVVPIKENSPGTKLFHSCAQRLHIPIQQNIVRAAIFEGWPGNDPKGIIHCHFVYDRGKEAIRQQTAGR